MKQPEQTPAYTIDDLRYLMARLRDPKTGCPWDLKQTPRSIINYSIEEVYELADAIESDNQDDICGELGDVLFQVIFFAQLAEEDQHFDLDTVVTQLCTKLVNRHPHIFTDGTLYGDDRDKVSTPSIHSAGDVAQSWEQIKAAERADKQRDGIFDDIPLALPATARAHKLQKRAAGVGFDWSDAEGALAKLKEEIAELEALLEQPDVDSHPDQPVDPSAPHFLRLQEELGDIFFSVVNVSRKLGVQSEQALRLANAKFMDRVSKVVAQYRSEHGVDAASLIPEDVLDELWEQVKRSAYQEECRK